MLTIRPVAIAAVLACTCAAAQTPPPAAAISAPQSLGQAVQQAISRNPEVLERLHTFQSSHAEQDATRGQLRPRIDAQAFGGYANSSSGGVSTSYSRPGANLQLRQLIFDGNAVSSDVRRAGFIKLSRYYDFLTANNQIALDTVQAYLDVLRYRELELLARDNWGFHNETMQQLERRAKAGVGRRVDMELSLGRTALSQSNWLTDSANLHDVMQRFQRLVGQPPADQLDPAPDVASRLPAAQQILPDAVRSNPSFLSAVAGIRAARADLDARRAAHSPTVELVAQTGTDRTLISTNTPGRTQTSSVQVLLNYNLYRGGADDARARQAQEGFYAAQDARDIACRNIRQTATIAYNDLRRLGNQLSFLEQHQLSTEKAREAYRQQFDIGQRSLLDLLDTENELFQARRAVVNARYDVVLAGYRVLQQTNGLLPALGQKPLVDAAPPEASENSFGEDEAALCSTEMTPPQVLNTAAVIAARPPLPPTPDLGTRIATAASTPTPPPAPAATAADTSAVEQAVREWAAAWAAKDLSKYMDYYAKTFQPQQGGLDAWKQHRARYLDKPGAIQVGLEGLKVTIKNGRAEAIFTQHYQSSNYNDVSSKVLQWVREPQGWKIQRETAQPVRP